jgi:intein-encoded DNA endonuclease-like protein
MNGYTRNLALESFIKMCEHIQVLFKIGQQYIRAFLRAGVDGESQSTAKPLGESP